jgi:hypothetical protein
VSNANGLTIRQFVNEWLAEHGGEVLTEEGLIETASRPGTDETKWVGLIYVNSVEVRYLDITVDPVSGKVTDFTVSDRR